jgi:trimeric autotransporter adhesin
MKIRIGRIAVGFLSLTLLVSAQTPPVTTPAAAANNAGTATGAPSVTGTGQKDYVPLWLSKSGLGDSIIYQLAGNVGIGTSSPKAKLDVNGAVNASTSFNLGGSPFAFGSSANQNALLGFAGNSAISGNFNTAVGSQALFSTTSGAGSTAIGTDALFHNTTGSGVAVGGSTLYNNTTGTGNTAIGPYALGSNTTADWNTAIGQQALLNNTTGTFNTASGTIALESNTTGNNNTADGFSALASNNTGSNNTALGYNAGPDANSTALSFATAIGAGAVVSASNALVLGGPLGSSSIVKVGIGTATPSHVFTIAQSAGKAISDGWTTYSSRRWKTNIQTLQDALGKVEQLRGVSYDMKANGTHEVGVIAEEVGAVVPEVVTWEKNGTEAQSVDYGRLTALLIEAVKQQQREIRDLRSELRATRRTFQKVKCNVASTHPTLVAAK